jgi:hypothetical protein
MHDSLPLPLFSREMILIVFGRFLENWITGSAPSIKLNNFDWLFIHRMFDFENLWFLDLFVSSIFACTSKPAAERRMQRGERVLVNGGNWSVASETHDRHRGP